MALRDLNEALHTREGVQREDVRPRSFDLRTTSAPMNPSREAFQHRGEWADRQEPFLARYRKPVRFGMIASALMVTVALGYFVVVRIQQSAFQHNRVTVTVDGPTEVGSENATFVFTYGNANRINLENVDLELSYPENFRPDPMENMTVRGSTSQVHIGTITGNSRGKIDLHGKFYGSKGSIAYIKGTLRYKPHNIESMLQTASQIGVTIASPSIKLTLDAPLEVSSGSDIEYRIDYTNTTDASFDNLRLKVEYPAGFRLRETVPKASEGDAVWYVGSLAPGQSGSIRLAGSIDGAKSEAKVIKAHIGVLQGDGALLSYSDGERLTKMVSSPLLVTQTVNGSVQAFASPGESLQYDVQYRNDGDVGLRNVIITLELQKTLLDYTGIKLVGGYFDDVKKTVTWKASDAPNLANLAPGQSGSVAFSIPVAANIPIKSETDKNFTITSIARIDSPDIPTPTGSNKIIGSNTTQVKIRSGFYVGIATTHESSVVSNSGPNPAQVCSETTYPVHVSMSTGSNDIDQIKVNAYLPTGVRFTGKVSPVVENIVYNERTNQLSWTVGELASGTGIVRPSRDAYFQVALTPQANQSKQTVPVLTETAISAHNVYTNESIQIRLPVQSISVR
jgi:hypothetical protein